MAARRGEAVAASTPQFDRTRRVTTDKTTTPRRHSTKRVAEWMPDVAETMSIDTFVDEQQDNSIKLEGHIVLVAGKSGLPYELLDFLGPLRARHLYDDNDNEADAADGPGIKKAAPRAYSSINRLRSIVILSEQKPTRRHFETVMMFQDVHFIRGSAQDEYALERASVFRSHTVILLATRRRIKSFRDPHMADSDAISTLKFIDDACQQRMDREQLVRKGTYQMK
jgi:hypothetical protein